MQEALQESVDFFSPQRKEERELWIGISFIKNLGLTFNQNECKSPLQDPPDILFRDAQFEIKEILDPGRKRHKEFKDKLENSYSAESPDDFLENYTPIDISTKDIGNLVEGFLKERSNKYDPKTKQGLDLLIYVNLTKHFFISGEMPKTSCFLKYGWRSVSVLFGWSSLVFYANHSSPKFLKEREGTVVIRKGGE